MIPVTQTKRGGPDVPPEERGDCFDACLASVFESTLEACHVPHDDDWWSHALDVGKRHGHALVLLEWRGSESPPSPAELGEWLGDVYWLAAIPSTTLGLNPDGSPIGHVVVMRGPDLAHDPTLGIKRAHGPLPQDVVLLDATLLVPLADHASRTLRREGWRARLAWIEQRLASAVEDLKASAYPEAADAGRSKTVEALAAARSMLDGGS